MNLILASRRLRSFANLATPLVRGYARGAYQLEKEKDHSNTDILGHRNSNNSGSSSSRSSCSRSSAKTNGTERITSPTLTPPQTSSSSSSSTETETNLIKKKGNAFREEIWTVPNIITYLRMAASPMLGWAIVYDYKTVAVIGCGVAGFSDWLDGYIARNYNQMTVLGGMLDPAADKIMITCLTIGCAVKGLMPVELAALIIGRDVLLLGGSFALRAREMPVGSPFFDTTHSATFEIIPSTLSKVNTVMQFGLITSTLLQWGLPVVLQGDETSSLMSTSLAMALEPLQYATAFTTLGSLIGYLDGSAIKRLSPSGEARSGQRHANSSQGRSADEAVADAGAGAEVSAEKK